MCTASPRASKPGAVRKLQTIICTATIAEASSTTSRLDTKEDESHHVATSGRGIPQVQEDNSGTYWRVSNWVFA